MRGTGESMETKTGSAATASISSPFCCMALSNLIRRVIFKHHLAQLLGEVRVGEEEPWGGESPGTAGKGHWAAPTIPNCRQPGTSLLGSKGESLDSSSWTFRSSALCSQEPNLSQEMQEQGMLRSALVPAAPHV